MAELGDVLASLGAETDQREARLAEILGIPRVSEDCIFLVSPDVGQRLTRDGVIPDRVRISWLLPEKSVYAIDPSVLGEFR